MVVTAVTGTWMVQRTGPPTANRSNVPLAVCPLISVSTSLLGSASRVPAVCEGDGEGEGDGDGDGEGDGDREGDGDADDEDGAGLLGVGSPTEGGLVVGPDPSPGVLGVT